MRVLREEILASKTRYQDTLAQAELRYQEKMKVLEEQLRLTREAERAADVKSGGTYTLADELLSDLRRRCPEWEVRRQKVQMVSVFVRSAFFVDGDRRTTHRAVPRESRARRTRSDRKKTIPLVL